VTPPLPSEPSSADALSFWKNPFLWLREKSLSRSFWIFFAVAFFYDAGLSIYVFLFNLYLLDFHFNERAIGLIGGSLMLGSLIGTLPAGVLARRFGLRPLLMFTLTAAPLIFVLRTLWVWEPAQLAIGFLAGISLSTWGVCFLPAVAKVTTERNRPAAFGLLFSAGIGTGALGGILCGYLPQWLRGAGFIMQPAAVKRLILLAACGMVLLGIVPMLSLRFPTPVETEPLAEAKPEAGKWLRGLRVHPFLLRYLPLMTLWAVILNSFPPFANVYLSRQLHTPLAHIGVIFSTAQVLQFFMGLVAPAVLRWLGLVNGIVAMLTFMAVALGAMDAAGNGGLTIAFYLAFAGTQWMSTSGLYSLLMNEMPDKDLSTASAMTMFCNTLAGSAATAGAGILFTRFGYPRVVAGIATLAVVTAVLFRLLLGQAKGRTVRHPELTNELLGRTD
jgi:MFS family permease